MVNMIGKNFEQFAVLGLGRFGSEIAVALSGGGKEVLAVDVAEDRIQAVSSLVTHAVTADATDEHVLKAIEISSFDAVIVAIGDVEASVVATVTLKELGANYIVAKASNDKHKRVLEKIGADYVIVPEAEMAHKLANRLMNKRLNDLMEVNDKYSIVEIAVPEAWSGKSLIELGVRNRFRVNVILVLAGGEDVISSPGGDTVLGGSDHMLVGGNNEDILKFTKYLNKLK